MSLFTDNFNGANTAFSAVAIEQFELVRNGNVGLYNATSIDDLVSSSIIAPGGFRGEATVAVHLSQEVLAASAAVDGSVLVVRGKRVRVLTITYDGDNTPMLQCTTAGVKL